MRHFEVGNLGQFVVIARVGHLALIQLARQPLAPVEIDLDFKREPTLETDVYEAELGVQVIQIEMQALAKLAAHFQFMRLGVAFDPKRPARFDHGEDTDQSRCHAVLVRDFPRPVFFGLFAFGRQVLFQIDVGPAGVFSHLLDMRLEFFGGGLDIATKVFEQDALAAEEVGQTLSRKEIEQVALEDNPVEGGQRSADHVSMYT